MLWIWYLWNFRGKLSEKMWIEFEALKITSWSVCLKNPNILTVRGCCIFKKSRSTGTAIRAYGVLAIGIACTKWWGKAAFVNICKKENISSWLILLSLPWGPFNIRSSFPQRKAKLLFLPSMQILRPLSWRSCFFPQYLITSNWKMNQGSYTLNEHYWECGQHLKIKV